LKSKAAADRFTLAEASSRLAEGRFFSAEAHYQSAEVFFHPAKTIFTLPVNFLKVEQG